MTDIVRLFEELLEVNELPMVERDRFERQFGKGWLAAYRYAREGNTTTEEICDKLTTALSLALRRGGGVPGFNEIIDILVNSTKPGVMAAFDALDGIVQAEDGHTHTAVAAGVAKSLIVQLETAEWAGETSNVGDHFAEEACLALVERYFFSKARQPLLHEQRFANFDEVANWQGAVEGILRPQLAKLAGKLNGRPDGQGLHAPPRLVKIASTGDLLNENLLTGQPLKPSSTGRPL